METVGQARGPQDVETGGAGMGQVLRGLVHTWSHGSQARREAGPEGLSSGGRVAWGRRAGGLQGTLALSRRRLRREAGTLCLCRGVLGAATSGRGETPTEPVRLEPRGTRALGGFTGGLGHPRSAGAPIFPLGL